MRINEVTLMAALALMILGVAGVVIGLLIPIQWTINAMMRAWRASRPQRRGFEVVMPEPVISSSTDEKN